MRITSLAENTSVSESIGAEHGLSLYIETEDHRILFDMGQTGLFAENGEKLGVDLSDVDIAVLSHGHYDHGGGLYKFLEINKTAPVYINENAFGSFWHGEKYIGIDVSPATSDRFVVISDEYKIGNGLMLYSCNRMKRAFNLGSFGLSVMRDGEKVSDDFTHEQYLLIEEDGKRVLISGCSHKGILNIVDWFFPDVLVGGFHFSGLPLDGTLREYAEHLDKSGAVFYTCHCTGTEQFRYMSSFMPKLRYLSGGDTIII